VRRLSRWLSVSTVVMVWALVAVPSASAHHYLGTCGEVGEWSESASTQLGSYNSGMGVLAYVGYVPAAADCFDNGVYRPGNYSTQHTSLHARRYVYGNQYCLETVAQRFNSGFLRMYGYDCGASGAANVHDIANYGSPWIYLYMTSGGTYNWQHWYYRYDTNQWVYLGGTNSPCCRYYNSWLESSGYNESSARGTLFRGYREWRSDGSFGTTNYPCPTTEDFDAHQEQFPNIGGYAENTDWYPATANYC